MAQRTPVQVFTHRDYLDALAGAADEARTKALYEALKDITPREIYEAEGFTSGLNVELIDGHIKFAMRKYEVDPVEPLRDWLRDALIDGWRIFRRDIEGGPLTPENPHLVQDVEFDARGERVVKVCLDYDYNADSKGEPWPMHGGTGEPQVWHYHSDLWIDFGTEIGDPERYYRWEHRYPKGSDATMYKPKVESLKFYPYIGIRWDRGKGLIEPVKITILRYETCLLNIGTDNNRHARRKMVFKGAGTINKTQEEFAEEGKILIGSQADVYYPDPHAEGIKPMFDELELLEERIRSTLGLEKVADLHNASGSSRMIEILPNMATAEMIREKSFELMALLHGEEFDLSFPPLVDYNPTDLATMKLTLKEAASKEEGVIDEKEYVQRMRYLLGFPPKEQKRRPTVV